MDAALEEINVVAGVHGSFAFASSGKVIAQAMPAPYDAARLGAIARLVTQTFDALAVSQQQLNDVDLIFDQHRLVLKNLSGGVLAILCARNINIPLLNMTAKNAVQALSAALAGAATAASAPSPSQDASALYLDLEKESQRIINAANSAQVKLCVMDPIALWTRVSNHARVAQPQKRHMDFLARADQANLVLRVFERMGYQANQRFNAFYGARFLNFNEPTRITSINVFLDAYDMNHAVNLTSVLEQNETIMTETGLVLMRLQWVEMTDALLDELCALFLEHDLGAGADKARIDATQITRICAEDWGWYRTVTMNLDRLRAFIAKALSPSEEALVANRLQRLRQGIEAAPKSLRWQARARIGDSVRWYETPQIGGATAARPDIAIG